MEYPRKTMEVTVIVFMKYFKWQ